MTAVLSPFPRFRGIDSNGNPLAFGSLTTYAAGTTNLQATYVDSTQTTQNTNPITLNAMGECALWLDPTLNYKFNLTDRLGNQVPGYPVDNINGAVASAQQIGLVLYPRSAAEIAASVTPTNYWYPYGNVLRYGTNTTPGTTDMSGAFIAALACNVSIYAPGGTYLVGNLVMPSTAGLVLYGDGTSTVLVQKADGNPLISWNQLSITYTEGYIERLAFKGTAGTNHTINTSGVGGITLQDLYFTDVPVGFSSIYLNGAAATYVHDQRLRNIQIYTNTAGHSGIRCGPLFSDGDIDNFIMNGNFVTSYCLYLDSGAQTTTVANSHPYNAAVNIVNAAGSNGSCYFDAVTFDNATNDLIVFTGSTNLLFTSCHFEAIKVGKNGVTLTNCAATSIVNCEWDAANGAGFAVNETGTSNQTFVTGGNIGTLGNYSSGPFNLIGALSWARGIAGYNPLGMAWPLVGRTVSAQAQNTTQYLGVNGAQSTASATYYLIIEPALCISFYVATDGTPAAGQTFTFTLNSVGLGVLGTITISNGSFSGTATINHSISQYDQLYIQSVFSATSGSSAIRWGINMTA